MSEKEQELDINDAFENLLFTEENAQSLSYMEGYIIGRHLSVNGYHLGFHRASVIAAQLGYYCGIIEQYLNTNKSDSGKVVAVGKEILQDISNFPRHNDKTVDIENTIDRIKSKYAKFCSLAKISPLYPELDKLNF